MADTSVTAPATARARRATRRDFVDCAFEILAESGHKGLTIHELCRKVGVSTGSFYHHFANWDEFVAALLTQWEGDQAQQMVEAATATSNLRRIEIARDLASMYQHGAEAAIRAWSLSNAQVRIAQEHVDDERRRHLVSLLRRSGVADDRADLLASVGLAILVGLQQLEGGADKIPDAMHMYGPRGDRLTRQRRRARRRVELTARAEVATEHVASQNDAVAPSTLR